MAGRFERIFELNRILAARRTPASLAELQEQLDCSRSTVNRTICDMRDHLNAPIIYDRERNGYLFDRTRQPLFELPGLWFNPSEVYALLTTWQLLHNVQPGLLTPHIKPLKERIQGILEHEHAGSPELARRVRILQMAPREVNVDQFRRIADALARRKRVRIFYHGRERDATTERTVSPQRLVYYRDNWYVDAWCHLRRGLRSFSIDRVHVAHDLDDSAKTISDRRLNRHFASAYGIFAGEPQHTAVLRFNKDRARWVADEQWHPRQEMRFQPDGGLELRVPYGDPRELLMDILKHGADVEVLAPPSLRRRVHDTLRQAATFYAEA